MARKASDFDSSFKQEKQMNVKTEATKPSNMIKKYEKWMEECEIEPKIQTACSRKVNCTPLRVR